MKFLQIILIITKYFCYFGRKVKNIQVSKNNFFYKAFRLYYDGIRNMTIGKTLWTVVIIKLFIMFVILKVFFFPNVVKQNSEKGQEDKYVMEQMMKR